MRAWPDEPEPEEGAGVIIQESSLLIDEGEVEEALKPDPAELLPTPSGTPAPDSGDTTMEEEDLNPSPREPNMTLLKLIDEVRAFVLQRQLHR